MGIYGSRVHICIIDELPTYSKAWKMYRINVVGNAKPSIDASVVLSIIKDPLDTAYTCIPIEAKKIREVGKYPCISMGIAPLSEITLLAVSERKISTIIKQLCKIIENDIKCHIVLIPWQVNLDPKYFTSNEVKNLVQVLDQIYKVLDEKGIIVVTSVGNHEIDGSIDPLACSKYVFSISGIELGTGNILNIASKPPNVIHPEIPKPDFVMPGIVKTEIVKNEELTCVSKVGTSVAASFFTGVLALFNEYLKTEINIELTSKEFRKYVSFLGREKREIERTGSDFKSRVGHGLLTCTQIMMYVDYLRKKKEK